MNFDSEHNKSIEKSQFEQSSIFESNMTPNRRSVQFQPFVSNASSQLASLLAKTNALIKQYDNQTDQKSFMQNKHEFQTEKSYLKKHSNDVNYIYSGQNTQSKRKQEHSPIRKIQNIGEIQTKFDNLLQQKNGFQVKKSYQSRLPYLNQQGKFKQTSNYNSNHLSNTYFSSNQKNDSTHFKTLLHQPQTLYQNYHLNHNSNNNSNIPPRKIQINTPLYRNSASILNQNSSNYHQTYTPNRQISLTQIEYQQQPMALYQISNTSNNHPINQSILKDLSFQNYTQGFNQQNSLQMKSLSISQIKRPQFQANYQEKRIKKKKGPEKDPLVIYQNNCLLLSLLAALFLLLAVLGILAAIGVIDLRDQSLQSFKQGTIQKNYLQKGVPPNYSNPIPIFPPELVNLPVIYYPPIEQGNISSVSNKSQSSTNIQTPNQNILNKTNNVVPAITQFKNPDTIKNNSIPSINNKPQANASIQINHVIIPIDISSNNSNILPIIDNENNINPIVNNKSNLNFMIEYAPIQQNKFQNKSENSSFTYPQIPINQINLSKPQNISIQATKISQQNYISPQVIRKYTNITEPQINIKPNIIIPLNNTNINSIENISPQVQYQTKPQKIIELKPQKYTQIQPQKIGQIYPELSNQIEPQINGYKNQSDIKNSPQLFAQRVQEVAPEKLTVQNPLLNQTKFNPVQVKPFEPQKINELVPQQIKSFLPINSTTPNYIQPSIVNFTSNQISPLQYFQINPEANQAIGTINPQFVPQQVQTINTTVQKQIFQIIPQKIVQINASSLVLNPYLSAQKIFVTNPISSQINSQIIPQKIYVINPQTSENNTFIKAQIIRITSPQTLSALNYILPQKIEVVKPSAELQNRSIIPQEFSQTTPLQIIENSQKISNQILPKQIPIIFPINVGNLNQININAIGLEWINPQKIQNVKNQTIQNQTNSYIEASQVAQIFPQKIVTQYKPEQIFLNNIVPAEQKNVSKQNNLIPQINLSPNQNNLIPTSQILASQISASQIPASQIPASQIPASQIPASQIPASQIPASQIPAPQIPAFVIPNSINNQQKQIKYIIEQNNPDGSIPEVVQNNIKATQKQKQTILQKNNTNSSWIIPNNVKRITNDINDKRTPESVSENVINLSKNNSQIIYQTQPNKDNSNYGTIAPQNVKYIASNSQIQKYGKLINNTILKKQNISQIPFGEAKRQNYSAVVYPQNIYSSAKNIDQKQVIIQINKTNSNNSSIYPQNVKLLTNLSNRKQNQTISEPKLNQQSVIQPNRQISPININSNRASLSKLNQDKQQLFNVGKDGVATYLGKNSILFDSKSQLIPTNVPIISPMNVLAKQHKQETNLRSQE